MTETSSQLDQAPLDKAPLPLLAEPAGYVACPWDLRTHRAQRAYWLGLFGRHFPTLLEHALEVAAADGENLSDARRRAQQAHDAFATYLDHIEANPQRPDRLTILDICEQRERVLRQAGFADPHRLAKRRETDAALKLLPRLLEELDAMPGPDRGAAVVRGVLAGNIFDLGATPTADIFRDGPVDFRRTREQLKPRPWLIDHLSAWLARLDEQGEDHCPYRAALLFVDNAGPDIVLGMLPLARELLGRGARVLLAANTTPTLNDVTCAELLELIDTVAAFDSVVRESWTQGRLRCLADGNGVPLIDLSRLSPSFTAAAAHEPIDLVVLEGMGRALESNFDAAFTCDALKLAMVKDQGVADALGGDLYDLVYRFEAA